MHSETDILRFEVADLNRVVQRSAADSELYGEIQAAQGHPPGWEVLVLSCFAVTETWTPARLAERTGFRRYRLAKAVALLEAGLALWPTEVFIDDVRDPRNDVHYDLVVAAGPRLVPGPLFAGTPAERRAALVPVFEDALALLRVPHGAGRSAPWPDGQVEMNTGALSMVTITKTVVPATVGPAELEAGRAYFHDAELDGHEGLSVGKRVEVLDEAGRYLPPR